MKLLAFDTSTETMSIAVGDGARLYEHTGPGGAQASAALIPAVLALLSQAGLTLAGLDAIAFGRGPGSFTGLRTACAVAQGLAFGAGIPVLPVDTLLAVAEDARQRHGTERVVAALDARMGEIYCAHCEYTVSGGWRQHGDFGLVRPEGLRVGEGWVLAGNVAAACGAQLPAGVRLVDALPTAGAMLRLAPALLRAGSAVPPEQALPLYIRDKVAQTTAERAALQAVAAAHAPTHP